MTGDRSCSSLPVLTAGTWLKSDFLNEPFYSDHEVMTAQPKEWTTGQAEDAYA